MTKEDYTAKIEELRRKLSTSWEHHKELKPGKAQDIVWKRVRALSKRIETLQKERMEELKQELR